MSSALLSCGILASLTYVATDIYAGSRYPGYSFADQAVSELSAAFKGWFRSCSAITVLVLLVPAVLSFSNITAFVANQPTPNMGLTERVSRYGYQLWQAVLAGVLLHRLHSTPRHRRLIRSPSMIRPASARQPTTT